MLLAKKTNYMKPFVKWVGGKTQFLEIISLLIPNDYNNLLEPFVGGGAVFLSIQPNNLIINDIITRIYIKPPNESSKLNFYWIVYEI